MTKIAAYDDDGIWGVGNTQEQAKAEAEGFLRDSFEEDEGEDGYLAAIAALKFAPIADEFLAMITGYNVIGIWASTEDFPYKLADGVLEFDADADIAADNDDGGDEEDEEEPETAGAPQPEGPATIRDPD